MKKFIKIVIQAESLEKLQAQLSDPQYDAYTLVGGIANYPDPRVGTYFYVTLQSEEVVQEAAAPETPAAV